MLIISYYLLPMIGFATCVKNNNDHWYEKKDETYCRNDDSYTTVGPPTIYTTLSEAEDACSRSYSCTMVYDYGSCDGDSYFICDGEERPSNVGSCVYIKRDSPSTESPTTTESKTTDRPSTTPYPTKWPTTTESKTTARPSTTPYPTTWPTATETKTTARPSTTRYPTEKSTVSPYNCLDITVEKCRDETLDVIDDVSLESIDDCHMMCSKVFENVCHSYIYNTESKNCKLLQDRLYYLDGCDILGAAHDSIQNCLEDDIKYPDMCKRIVESDCVYYGNVLLTDDDVLTIDQCILLKELLRGQFYIYENDHKRCTVYDNDARYCSTIRGVDSVEPSSCPN